MKNVLVTGAHGQLGTELNFLASLYESHSFTFVSHHDLDIANESDVNQYFSANQFDTVINCAAYTAVDKAESEKEVAFLVNATAAAIMAKACNKHSAKLIHFSTDFVFDGTAASPLQEENNTNPGSVYGLSKLEGEKLILHHHSEALIIRTSWLYSSFGNNFVKTILRLCREKESINVIYDQVGTPTYARDLAGAVLQIIQRAEWEPGIYHYSNEGVASWYDFAIAIRDMAGLTTPIQPIETYQYPTPAQRPKYSVLNKAKFKNTFNLTIPYWRESLQSCMKLLLP